MRPWWRWRPGSASAAGSSWISTSANGTDFAGKPPEWGREKATEWRKTRYHQPSDEIYDEWDFSGMVLDARLGFLVGLSEPQPAVRGGDHGGHGDQADREQHPVHAFDQDERPRRVALGGPQ